MCHDIFYSAVCEVITSVTANKGEWASIDHEFEASTSEWDWAFFENGWATNPEPSDIPDFKIDDVSLVVVGSGDSILPAGDFENGFDGWTTDTGAVRSEEHTSGLQSSWHRGFRLPR